MSGFHTHLRRFVSDTSGAVTVDWVLLTAGLVAVCLAATAVVGSGLEVSTADLDETLSTDEPFDSLWEWGDTTAAD